MNSEFEKDGLKHSRHLRLTPLREASGGTCNAYEARLSGKKVFVKEIKPEFADDARMLAAFRKEAEIGFRLDHPNLSKYIFAEGVLPPERYIVQEFIDGQTLPDFIKENPTYFRDKRNLKRFVRELSDVIDYLHRNGIVHLDLKPENIIITRVGHALKLVDMGFCASDFYDDTRGFTRSELAPEGLSEPRARGVESDYYGIGKILSYIRCHTPGLSGGAFSKLESRLLHPDPAKRLASKEEIEKILKRNNSVGRAWLTGACALIVSVLVLLLVWVGVPDSHDTPSDEPVENPNLPTVNEPETNNIEEADIPIEPSDVGAPKESPREMPKVQRSGEENLPPQHQEANTPVQSEFSYDSYNRLKAEMAENIHKNFAGFEKMLSAYLREGKFTQKDYKTVIDTYNSALHKTFKTDSYKAKYKDLSPSMIDDTIGDVLQQIENASWGPVYKKYIQEYRASDSGSSK